MRSLPCLFIVLLFSGLEATLAQQPPPLLALTIEQVLVLGDDEAKPAEYLFGDPEFIAIDKQKNIYVSDRSDMTIKVYDAQGAYLRSIGSRGQGPGEFNDITTVTLDQEGHLVVVDDRQQRITCFTPLGAVVDTRLYERKALDRPRRLHQDEAGAYVFLGLVPTRFSSRDAGYLFHAYTSDLRTKQSAFLRFYDAKRGGRLPSRARLSSHLLSITPDSVYAGLVHNRSIGLHRLKNGHVIHFTSVRNEDGDAFLMAVEVFSEASKLIGYTTVDLDADPTKTRWGIHGIWKDEEDRFYLVDRRGFPKVRVVAMSYRVQP